MVKITADHEEMVSRAKSILDNLAKIVRGKKDELKVIVSAIIAGGHILIEGPPGSAKTLTAYTLSRLIGGRFRRVQGNPDLLPTDITGYHIYTMEGKSTFIEGPIFTNILMFDELNRTPPRSQSALLQAMAEYHVSIDGQTYSIPKPFHVLATEIPIESERGVYPLTLTLIDRFWVKIVTGYVSPEYEYEIIRNADLYYDFDNISIEPIMNIDEFIQLQKFISEGVYVDDRIVKYILDILSSIRNDERVMMGPSHRGGIYLYRISKALALLEGRDYVIPDDVKYMAPYVLVHRILLSEEETYQEINPIRIVEDILTKIEVPKE